MEVMSKKVNILKEISSVLKSMIHVNVSDGVDLSTKNRVYGVENKGIRIFFDTKKELREYILENSLDVSSSFKVDYMGSYAHNDNVIRIVKKDGIILYKVVDEYTCLKFDKDKSLKCGEPIWEFGYKNITGYYKALGRKIG